MSLIKTTFIYGLTDPDSGLVYYVGKSNTPSRRRTAHVNDARNGRGGPRFDWIRALLSSGREPGCVVLQEVSQESWGFYEKWWISEHRRLNPYLTNMAEGGEGIDSETATRINTGRRLTEATKKKIADSIRGHVVKNGLPEGFGRYNRTGAHREAVRQWSSPLSWDDVDAIRFACANGERQLDVAARYGVSQGCISGIVTRKTWNREDENGRANTTT